MRRILSCLLFLTLGASVVVAKEKKTPSSGLIAQGEKLVQTHGCADCHTPLKMGHQGPEPDLSRSFSGHPQEMIMPPPPRLPEGPWLWIGSATNTAFAGPWGISYATNLTSDTKTGLGAWKIEHFIQSIKTGKHWGEGRPILPPMPWQAYSHLSENDLKAIFAYLQSLPPIENQVPSIVPPQAP